MRVLLNCIKNHRNSFIEHLAELQLNKSYYGVSREKMQFYEKQGFRIEKDFHKESTRTIGGSGEYSLTFNVDIGTLYVVAVKDE